VKSKTKKEKDWEADEKNNLSDESAISINEGEIVKPEDVFKISGGNSVTSAHPVKVNKKGKV
jgi:hypothetical protein